MSKKKLSIVDYRHRRFFEVFSSVTFFDRLPVETTDEQNLKETSRDDTKLFRYLKLVLNLSKIMHVLFTVIGESWPIKSWTEESWTRKVGLKAKMGKVGPIKVG